MLGPFAGEGDQFLTLIDSKDRGVPAYWLETIMAVRRYHLDRPVVLEEGGREHQALSRWVSEGAVFAYQGGVDRAKDKLNSAWCAVAQGAQPGPAISRFQDIHPSVYQQTKLGAYQNGSARHMLSLIKRRR